MKKSRLKLWVLPCLLALGLAGEVAFADAVQVSAETADPTAVAPSEARKDKLPADSIGDGNTRVSVKGGDFSILPPHGWEIYTSMPGLSVMMQVPHAAGMKYQRTIQVAAFAEPRYIDEVTAKELEDVITRKFSASTSSIEGYRIRSHLPVEMADGRNGMLIYSEFTLEGVSMMQAHILVSSKTRHYLMSYTDIASHFEGDGAAQFLTEAWNSMISVELGSRTPARYETAMIISIGIAVLLLMALTAAMVRRWRSGFVYRQYAAGRSEGDDIVHDDDDDDDEMGRSAGPVSRSTPKGAGRRAHNDLESLHEPPSRHMTDDTRSRQSQPQPAKAPKARPEATGQRSQAAVDPRSRPPSRLAPHSALATQQPSSAPASSMPASRLPSSHEEPLEQPVRAKKRPLPPPPAVTDQKLPVMPKSAPPPPAPPAIAHQVEGDEEEDPFSFDDEAAS